MLNIKDITNTIIQGDCLEVMKQMPDKYIIVTDPPFNVGYHYDKYNDKIPELNYYRMLSQLIKDRPSVVIHYAEHLHNISIKLGYAPKKVVSWVYNSNTPKQHRQIAFYNVKPNFTKVGQPYKNPTDKRIAKRIAEGKTAKLYDWWNINQVKNVSNEKTSHPCQMPLQVMERIIGILPDDMLIVDPFSGSGTTAVACEKMGRNYIGIEISPEYCEIARKRVQEAKDSMGLFND